MAKSKDDIKYATEQAKLSEDESLRVGFKHGTPLEGGKIADSEPVDLFSSAHNIAKAKANATSDDASNPSHPQGPQPNTETASTNSNTATG